MPRTMTRMSLHEGRGAAYSAAVSTIRSPANSDRGTQTHQTWNVMERSM